MNVTDNHAVRECAHGITQDVTADSLYDILYEFWTIAFDTLPFFIGTDTFIGDGFPAKLVFTNLWFYIAEISS